MAGKPAYLGKPSCEHYAVVKICRNELNYLAHWTKPNLPKMKNFLFGPLMGYLARLRFPQLFLITAILFVADLIVPDFIPFIDELLLGLFTLLLGTLRKGRKSAPKSES